MEPEEEPQPKRPHLNNHDIFMARHSASPPPDEDKPVIFSVSVGFHNVSILVCVFRH